jgi:hypothetical protein
VFHWHLEFPEIFHGTRPDPLDADQKNTAAWMDGFVGNPPFAGKNGIIDAGGEAYLPWLQTVHEGAHGNADLSAHFFRRAFHLLGAHGTIGFIATNTIAQGDTRTTGLKHLVAHEGAIFDGVKSMKWPVPGANVAVSVVHVAKGHVAGLELEPMLDGRRVGQVNSRLKAKPERPDPVPLKANADKSFVGSYVLGMGFVLTPQQREELIRSDKKNAERIFRYIGGEEINSDPDPKLERYVINFGEMSLEEAERWPDLIKIVRTLVKPERDTNKREGYRKYWWQFGEKRVQVYEALRPLERCLGIARVTKHSAFSTLPSDVVLSEQVIVFPLEARSYLAGLQSRVHEAWARMLSGTMRTDLRYSPSDCFETFPFPDAARFAGLEAIGARLDTERSAYMKRHKVGLTTTYNRLKDPQHQGAEEDALRSLHEELDRAVLAAYGWSDIPVPPYCAPSPADFARFEDEVLDRLFDLNAQRAKAEALEAPQPPKASNRKKKG